jgi:hypothetical protein
MSTRMGVSADSRTCDRVNLNRSISVMRLDGPAIDGRLINVSLGGVSIELAGGTHGFARGQTAALRLSPEDREHPYQCEVMWARDGLLGLSIDRKSSARLALAITRGMFARSGQAVQAAPAIEEA